ncbi:dihydropteroate synthase [Rhodothermus profundi]|uniref:Dihydropteroate synthase n=1 Tax=Rhodothermus profundi TaxID=633813 RepID=A0A1M6TYE0_9BACT|nr:dihydropteroate synthase [Rhodothermus profundi]SHK61987.1 Dihydropteroate synthase [Rhodothermus profundi]
MWHAESFDRNRFVLNCRGRLLDCRPGLPGGAQVMGILNVTPDSFWDGGRYQTVDAALRRAETMLKEGAAIIDVGGESTRPRGRTYGRGAAPVSPDEERRRVLPVIEAIAQRFPEAIISVDTYKPEVARDALEAGAHVINDQTGLRLYPEMAEVAARFDAPLILMHSVGRPGEMPHELHYDDVVGAVRDSLAASISRAHAAGVRQVVIDPGFGFGKTAAENLQLVNNIDVLLRLGYPVLVGISRKSTIGQVLGAPEKPVPPAERLYGTLGATAVAVLRGATLVRTHDVKPTVEMLRLLAATLAQPRPESLHAV